MAKIEAGDAVNRYSPEDIVRELREAEVLLSQSKTVSEVVRPLGNTEQTYYRGTIFS